MTTTGRPVRRRRARGVFLPGLLVLLLAGTGAPALAGVPEPAPSTGVGFSPGTARGPGAAPTPAPSAGVGSSPGTARAPGAAPAPAPSASACPGQEVPPGPPAPEETVTVVEPLAVPDPPVGDLAVCAEEHVGPVPPPPVGVASYVLADLDSGAVLATRAPHSRQRPASTIKLLLAMVVDDVLPPDRVVVGTVEDANVEGSRAGLGPGGRYTVDQLLHGLLLASGNDAAHALARELGGMPATLAAMQDTARRLGALDTRPATPSGLDGPGMSSSAYDLALILRAALQRPHIATALLTPSIPFPGFGDQPGFELGNDDRLLGSPGFLGGKNGFTDAARHTFVGAVERDGRRLVVALVRGESQPVRMVDQARVLLDWGFGAPTEALGTLVPPGTTAPAGPAVGSGSGTPGSDTDTRSADGNGPGGNEADPSASGDRAGAASAAVVGGVAALVGVGALVAARSRRRR